MQATQIRNSIDAVWRMESARIIAGVARLIRDVGAAEELAQDALVAALQQWPSQGIPANPGAWLTTTAKRRAIDWLRRRNRWRAKHEDLAYRWDEAQSESDETDNLDEAIGDNVLRLIFSVCHPILPTDARVALALKTLGGFSTEEIARAFVTQEATIAQRIVRAKRTLAEKQIPFEVPPRDQWADRLASVLEVIYLLFNEGYSATVGADWTRPALCEEAQRLGRVLAELQPDQAEVHGLIALMELHASRLKARTKPDGEAILLLEQNRTLWDRLLIHRGLTALARGIALGQPRGFYLLQAEIAACHARALTAVTTNWQRIAHLYAELLVISPSPIIELNRAVAVGMSTGPQAALPLVDKLLEEPTLQDYHLLPSVRGDLLEKLGRPLDAMVEFERAIQWAKNEKEKEVLFNRIQKSRQVIESLNASDIKMDYTKN